jgi:hypothetical protein
MVKLCNTISTFSLSNKQSLPHLGDTATIFHGGPALDDLAHNLSFVFHDFFDNQMHHCA